MRLPKIQLYLKIGSQFLEIWSGRLFSKKLQKKVRKLGLRHALSIKFSEGAIHIIDSTKMNEPKTADLVKSLANFESF